MFRVLCLVLIFCGAGLFAQPCPSATDAPTLDALEPQILDLATGEFDGSAFDPSLPRWVTLGDVAYFVAFDPLLGHELWRSDGTEEGTWLVKDICPGPCSGLQPGLDRLRVIDGQLAFAATDEAYGKELWLSDGTAGGTRLLADLCFGPCSSLQQVWTTDAMVFVSANDGVHGFEPWTVDLAGNAKRLGDLCPGSCSSVPTSAVAVGDELFFTATRRRNGVPHELFVTDPEAGARQLTDAESASLISGPVRFGDGAAFVAFRRDVGEEIWVSDGTLEGTDLLLDLCPGDCSGISTDILHAEDGVLYLGAVTARGGDPGLVRTDGTEAGTLVLAPELRPTQPVQRFGDLLLFGAFAIDCTGLWATGGTLQTTHALRCGSLPSELAEAGGRLYAVFSNMLYAGSADMLEPIAEFYQPPVAPAPPGLSHLTRLGDRIVFKGRSVEEGFELWSSDGTPAGTSQTRNISRGGLSSSPSQLAELGGAVFFQIARGSDEKRAVWRVDGTDEGSFPLPAGPRRITPFLRQGEALLYSSAARSYGSETPGVWRTDGTLEGTFQLTSQALAVNSGGGFARRFFFQAETDLPSGRSGAELWVTNGRPRGTRLVADLYPGTPLIAPPIPNSSSPAGFTPLGSRVVFAAAGEGDRELWVSDGTAAGTELVRDICLGCQGRPGEITRLGKNVVFAATHPRLGRELWRSDGTTEGTRPVRDLRRGRESSAPHDLVALRRRIVFAARADQDASSGDDPALGEVLWRTDATLAGTRRLVELGPGAFVTESLRIGRRGFFAVADPRSGPALWVSDGTRRGTHRLLTLPGGSVPRSFAEVDDLLLFAADDGLHGDELWMSDGTVAGTLRLTDLAPGVLPSGPREITAAGDHVYFSANDGSLGRELWSIDRAALRR